MKTKNLSSALDLLSQLSGINRDSEGEDIAIAAQQELSELTKLVDVVKGFIEDNGIKNRSELKAIDHDEALDLMVDICDIVGYKE